MTLWPGPAGMAGAPIPPAPECWVEEPDDRSHVPCTMHPEEPHCVRCGEPWECAEARRDSAPATPE